MAKIESDCVLSNALICDDVRTEKSNKEIIIGVYSGDILVGEFPANISVCLWLLLETKGSSEIEREIRVVGADGGVVLEGKFHTIIQDLSSGVATVILQKMPIAIPGPGVIRFQWRKAKGRWSTIITKNVSLRKEAANTNS